MPFLRRKSSPSLTSGDLNKEECQKGEFLSSWRLVSSSCGCKRAISASRLSKPVFPIVYSSLWSIWAKDLLRHVRTVLNKNSLISDVQIFTGLFISTFG